MTGSGKKLRRSMFPLLLGVSFWLCLVALYHTHKPFPDLLNYRGEAYTVGDDDLTFIYDLTFTGADGTRKSEQRIFDTIFKAIDDAQHYVLIDMFLFNGFGADNDVVYRNLSRELTELLIDKKQANPQMAIDFITDPINTVYGGGTSPEISRLEDAGINVVVTDLHKLRDSNYIYSAVWRTFFQWTAMLPVLGSLKHPFSGEGRVTLAGYLDLFNFKANHRKVVVADHGDDMITIVTSANPHDGSSEHSNTGLVVRGDIWRSVYESEQSVARMSGGRLSRVDRPERSRVQDETTVVRVLTERQIKEAIIESCKTAGAGDLLKLAQFYLAERDIIEALLQASENGADVKIILDPNKDAFGYEKNGIPNRQTGSELAKRSRNRIKVRWYDTRGEQFHTKLFVKEHSQTMTVITGSANLTRRNLNNYNLELALMAELDRHAKTAEAVNAYFERIWSHENGVYSVDFGVYRDDSVMKYILYRLQEGLGLGTF